MEEQSPNVGTSLERAIGKLEGKMDLMVSSMSSLASSFESLEKGRLSRLEIQFASLQTEVKDKAKNAAMKAAIWVSIITGVSISIISGIISYTLHIPLPK